MDWDCSMIRLTYVLAPHARVPSGSRKKSPTTQVVGNLPNAFELILAQFEPVEESLRLFHHDGEIVDIDADVFIMGLAVLHPDIRVSLTGGEAQGRDCGITGI